MALKTDHISKNPMDRIPREMKKGIKKKQVRFDVHCHIFNYLHVPDGFLGIRFNLRRPLLGKLELFLHDFIRKSNEDKLSNIAYFLNFFKENSSSDLAKRLFTLYRGRGSDTVFCPLMMDMEPGIKGGTAVTFYSSRGKPDQIDLMKDIRDDYPDKILPFLAVDPNGINGDGNRYADIFNKAFSPEYNFFGLKIYPSLGYLPSDKKLMELFEICEDRNIPVTSHCSGAIVHNSRRILRSIDGIRQDYNMAWKRGTETRFFAGRSAYAEYFNHPKNWLPVLRSFPKLKLNLAHFGGTGEWEKLKRGKKNTWPSHIMDLMSRYENVYADFSYGIAGTGVLDLLRRKIEDNRLIAERTLFGSDFYMIIIEGRLETILVDFETTMGDSIMKQTAEENPARFLLQKV